MQRERKQQILKNANLQYDADLPIVQRREEILQLLRKNQVIIVCGETGSGKSTQLPKFCLEIGRGIHGTIGHTQPRRIAARTLAARIADELQTPLGEIVGYKVRFEEKLNRNAFVKLMTDGILLAETQSDRDFRQYDTLIIDEAHERTLNIDFLLGMLKRTLPHRPDLKIIITSATLDAQRFAEHFNDAPIIEVSGRSYPIEILYRDSAVNDLSLDEERDENDILLDTVNDAMQMGGGDILVFLPTERDILDVSKLLRGAPNTLPYDILPLFSRLSVAEQQKVFQPSKHRKIVLATNVAESSLTVPGIRYVIDSGIARISRYSARSRTQRLPIEAVSQASADQRAGRCGRVGPGVCIRLYSEQDYLMRDKYTSPEIRRTNLASVILQTKALKLGAVETFPFLDPPTKSAIADGYDTLYEIGAIDKYDHLTSIGWKLSKFPTDPRIGRMILAAADNGILDEMLVIAAALEIQDPRERPQEHKGKADGIHRQFFDPRSDYVAFLNLWKFYQDLKEKLSWNQLRKACKQNFLSFNRMKEWSDVHSELVEIISRQGLPYRREQVPAANELNYEALHRSILTGNLSGIAYRETKFEYNVCRSAEKNKGRFVLWAGSGVGLGSGEWKMESEQRKNLPNWIIASERIETSRRFLRTAAEIKPEWIEPLAKHLITKHYCEAHWNSETGYVHAYEKITLLGLTLVPKRRCNYGPIDPKTAREVFIQKALVEQDLQTDCEFFEYNQLLLEEARKLQDKLRRGDILKPESAKYEFYDARIPATVYDKRTLEKWIKTENQGTNAPRSLIMSLSDLCSEPIPGDIAEQFPNQIETFENSSIEVEYNYQPGEENDGPTIIVPKEGLRQIEPAQLGWLVPGLIERKIIAMLKSLPKDLRRQLVPIPDTAKDLLRKIDFGKGTLEEQLVAEVSRMVGHLITVKDFDSENLPRELRMNIRVLDEKGQPLKESRNLSELRKEFGVKSAQTVSVADPQWNRTDIMKWDFGNLPEFIEIQRGTTKIKAFPMLQCSAHTIGVAAKLADSLDRAIRETQHGITRLFYLANERDIQTQVEWLPNCSKLKIYAQSLPEFEFKSEIGMLIAARALRIDELPLPRTATEWERRSETAREQLSIAVQDVTKLIVPMLENFQSARLALEKTKHLAAGLVFAVEDVKRNIENLTAPGFLLQTPWTWLKEYPRYLKAVSVRLENPVFSRTSLPPELQYRQRQYEERLELHQAAGITDPELENFRWMLEEYRVSLFAQKLGTAVKVSPQRLDKQWEKVRQ